MKKIEIFKMEKEDIDTLVELHISAFNAYASTKLGKTYLKPMFENFLRENSAINLVAKVENKICGYVIGVPPSAYKKFNKNLIFPAALGILKKPYLIFDLKILKKIYQKIVNFKKKEKIKIPEPIISLIGIGVDTNERGKGIGDVLIKEFEKEANERGFKSMRLTVFKDNLSAKKLYEKNNWIPVDTPFNFLIYYKIII